MDLVLLLSKALSKINHENEISMIVENANQAIKRLQKRLEKTNNNDIVDFDLRIVNCNFLLDLIQSLIAIIVTTGINLQNIVDFDKLLMSVVSAYQIATSSLLQTQYKQSVPDIASILNDNDCTDELSKAVRSLKRSIISFMDIYISINFLESPSTDNSLENLCDFMLSLFEKCNDKDVYKPCIYFYDAPLVLDLELTLQLSQRFAKLNILYNARLDYLQTSIQNQVTYSGNLETSRFISLYCPVSVQNSSIIATAEIFDDLAVTTGDDFEKIQQICELHDIFPHLGEGFIEALLLFTKDPEVAMMRILENNFPPEIDRLDRNISRISIIGRPEQQQNGELVVRVPSPQMMPGSEDKIINSNAPEEGSDIVLTTATVAKGPDRLNIFDGDDYDIFNKGFIPIIKPNIIPVPKNETIQLFNQYNDEYDDTYDASSTVIPKSSGGKDGEESEPSDPIEAILVECFNIEPAVFHTSQRKEKNRSELIKKTKMTHEQIEGWYTMMLRNDNMQAIIEKYEIKRQDVINSTRWRPKDEDEEQTEDSVGRGNGAPTRFSGRGRGGNVGRGRSKAALQYKMNKGMLGGDRS
jgi:hypothetical protein